MKDAIGVSGLLRNDSDAAGNLTSIPLCLVADGMAKTLGSNYTVKYDAWNRLSTVADGSTVIQTNLYDGLHRRVSRESNTTGVRHFYWNESWQCVEERVDASTTADRQYVWHPYYIDALAISYNSSGTTHYYVQDGNFNVTAAMDSSGAVVERYSTTPYGECIVLNADFTLDSSSGGDGLSDVSNEFTYTGRRLDVETGLYQYRHRYYHAQLGRFVNRDPIGYEGSEWNLCEYAESKPVDMVDPDGLLISGSCEMEYVRCLYTKSALCAITDTYIDHDSGLQVCDWECQCTGAGWYAPLGFVNTYMRRPCHITPGNHCCKDGYRRREPRTLHRKLYRILLPVTVLPIA